MDGRGGGQGCLVTHCVEWSQLLLHCTCAGLNRGILFQGWFFGLEDVEIECVEEVNPRDDVGVCVEVDEQVEVVVEHVAGSSVEIAGALVRAKADQLWVEERVGEGVEIVWLMDPRLFG